MSYENVICGRGAGNRTRVTEPPALHNNHYTTPRRQGLFAWRLFFQATNTDSQSLPVNFQPA